MKHFKVGEVYRTTAHVSVILTSGRHNCSESFTYKFYSVKSRYQTFTNNRWVTNIEDKVAYEAG